MARPNEAFVSGNLFDLGIGYVVFTRFRGGKAESGIFLLDVYCLGVKNAFYALVDEPDYEERILDRAMAADHREPIDPASARKLVEGAAAYAQRLGFAPHLDYRKACRVFGGTKAADSTATYAFGKNGKPLYVQGPSDSLQKCVRIVKQLRARCGEDGYDVLAVGNEAEIGELERAGLKVRQKVPFQSEAGKEAPEALEDQEDQEDQEEPAENQEKAGEDQP